MVNSIDSTLLAASGAVPTSSGVLQSQLSRYEIQLADWCACPTGKTPAGKEKIADLQTKADATRAQLQQVEAARAASKVAATAETTDLQSAQGPLAARRFLDVVV